MSYANYAFGAYLEHSCRYYLFDAPVISDAAYDSLCAALLEQWDEVTHRHKHLVSPDDLHCGSGYAISYPTQIINLVRAHPHRALHEVFNPMAFADEHEEKAYHAICLLKYGSYGGTVNAKDIKMIGDLLRGHPLKPKMVMPKLQMPTVAPTLKMPALTLPNLNASPFK